MWKVVFVCVIVCTVHSGSCAKIDPVLFTNNRVYALQNQHTGKYLTVGEEGVPTRSSDYGQHKEDQLWKVRAVNKEGFQLVPINGEPALETLWKPIYLGYGKYQLQHLDGDTCLEASTMTQIETPCSKENLAQEWFPTLKELKGN